MPAKMTRLAVTMVMLSLITVAFCHDVPAGTRTVTFGWEDGTSTASFNIGGNALNPVYNSPDVGMGALANVSTGMQRDYGPSTNPFVTPVDNLVTPHGGNRMLEITLSNLTVDAGTDAFIYLGVLTGLDPGDTYQYTMFTHDPTDDRSPSAVQNSTYAQTTTNINTFDGFGVRLQRFTTTTGWLEEQLDANPPTSGSVPPASAVDRNVIFDPDGVISTTQGSGSISNMADAVRLEADLTYQSLTALNGGAEKFYIDDITITVTSNNPNASIWLPDGSVVLVNTPMIDGDFNNDGFWNCADINALTAVTAAMSNDPNFDLNGDNAVNDADITDWLAEGGAMNPAQTGGDPFLRGDANLDGLVDGQDFITWNSNKFTTSTPWCNGNFNGDAVIDGQDFITWNTFKFQSADSLSAVPEPSISLLGLCGLAGLARIARRR